MVDVGRIAAQEVNRRLDGGESIVLICGYEDEGAFAAARLLGAISLAQFRSRKATYPKNQPIIFYCG